MADVRRRGAAKVRLGALLIVGVALFLGPATRAEASGVTVADLNQSGVTPTTLAQSLAGGGVTVSNATFTGANRAGGSFTGGTGNVGPASGVVLSSGFVQTNAGDDPCSRGVEGPNNCNEDPSAPDGSDNTASLGLPGDTALNALVAPNTTNDATILEFDFVPAQGTVDFSYVFSSEEYNDFANSSFNDVFAFFVNGTNCALVPGTSDPVSVNTINNGDPGGDPTPHHPELYRDNVRPTPGSIDSQMDGLTTVLTCHATVNAGVTNHIKLAIADVSDSILDSAVFIQAGSLVSGNVLTVSKSGTGGGTVTSSPAGIDCGATCSQAFTAGTMVTLTPTPNATSTFTSWSGACTGSGACVVTMDAAKSVTAQFDALPSNTLTVSKSGNGSGTVTSSPAGIDCGSTCSSPFLTTDSVTLTPTPSAGSTFTGWSGDCTGTGACVVTMDQARSVTATFTLNPVVIPPPVTATCNGETATIVGTEGKDVLKGTPQADVIAGLGGKDQIKGRKGNDLVCAGAGKDKVVGGAGADDLFGEGGADLLNGNKGNDHLNGGPGEDKCHGGSGNNTKASCEH
jgi:uncharacterized repeat protein (TIGR02543 family)